MSWMATIPFPRSSATVTGWNLSTALYSRSFSTSAKTNTNEGQFFKGDGKTVFVVCFGTQKVFKYSLTDAWDVTTMTYVSEFSVSSEETEPRGVSFKPDGTRMYITGNTSNSVIQYNLSTAWDITTATDSTNSIDTSGEGSWASDLFFSSDGTKCYVVDEATNKVSQYTLSTAWDASSGSYASKSKDVTTQTETPTGIYMKSDGLKMYIVGRANSVWQYTLSTAWDVSSATYDTGKTKLVSAQETDCRGLFFSSNGLIMFVAGITSDTIFQYPLSTAWDISTASYTRSFSAIGQENNARGLIFSPDGTKAFCSGLQYGSHVYKYNLSTAWDASTGTYSGDSYDCSGDESVIGEVRFKPDGTKMYMVGYENDTVYQYNLSTAWTLSSAGAAPEKSFSVVSQESGPASMDFSADGTKMYIAGSVNDTVYQYNLSTAWDVGSADYTTDTKNMSVTSENPVPSSIKMGKTGTKCYITRRSGHIWQYGLTTAWDISTGSYDTVTYAATTQEATIHGIDFSPNGLDMYIYGHTSNVVYQYTLTD